MTSLFVSPVILRRGMYACGASNIRYSVGNADAGCGVGVVHAPLVTPRDLQVVIVVNGIVDNRGNNLDNNLHFPPDSRWQDVPELEAAFEVLCE